MQLHNERAGGGLDVVSFYALSYASKALVQEPDARSVVADIVSISQDRNERLHVTGALLFSGGHFAQMLEGPRFAVKELMVSIERDHRHQDVRIVQQGTVDRRAFAGWSLAYSGPSTFIDMAISQAFDGAADPQQPEAARLLRLFDEFARSGL